MIKITRDEFLRYEEVRQSGKYNMNFPDARLATGLDSDRYLAIIENYKKLTKRYPDVVEIVMKQGK